MATLQELIAQRAELERQIAHVQRTGRIEAVSQIRSLMTEYGLTIEEISAKPPRAARKTSNGTAARKSAGPRAGGKVAPKYRNATTGDTWTGRGLQPKWLKSAIANGARLTDFAI